ncbi:alpha/beta fold hydrolase [Nonomuraea rubra]|uniref:alpha/beta fold hydrolase n=1 Tax=Nonomuraea rubra TaxID=46180 RepID=UPI0036115FF8
MARSVAGVGLPRVCSRSSMASSCCWRSLRHTPAPSPPVPTTARTRVSHVVALDALHYLSLFPAMSEEQVEGMLRVFREDFAAGVRGLVEGGSPEGTDPALKDAYFEKMVAVRQPAGVRSIEGLVRWDMDAALREIRQPVTVFAIRELVTREAIERYGDRLEIVLVELGSHHFPVESPEGTAELLAGVVAAEAVPPEPTP